MNSNSLFLQTPPVNFSHSHAKILALLLEYGDLEQREIKRITKINKTTVSESIQDLVKICWCTFTNNGIKVIHLIKCKKKEIFLFLERWKILSKCYLIRPHHLIMEALYHYNEESDLNDLFIKLSQNDKIKIKSHRIINNIEHNLVTRYGTITFYQPKEIAYDHYYKLKITLKNFVIPILKEDLEYMQEYINMGISKRKSKLFKMLNLSLIEEHLTIEKTFFLKNLHIGLIAKKDIHKTTEFENILKENKLICDDSIYGQDEIEAKRALEIISENLLQFIKMTQNAKIELN